MAESKSGGGSSASSTATQEKQSKTDTALKTERGQQDKDEARYGVERDGDGNVTPLEYPETEVKDSITYVDPRPKDWPQKADRSVFVGAVHQLDPEKDVSGNYVDNAGLLDQDELELGGTVIEDLQVVAGGGQTNIIINGEVFVGGPLSGALNADLASALLLNANS